MPTKSSPNVKPDVLNLSTTGIGSLPHHNIGCGTELFL